jgi:hypothetical protein
MSIILFGEPITGADCTLIVRDWDNPFARPDNPDCQPANNDFYVVVMNLMLAGF